MRSDGAPSQCQNLCGLITQPPLQRDSISHSALQPSKKLMWIESLFAELICNPVSLSLGDEMVAHLQEFFDHPYKKVRRRIGRILALTFYNRYHPPASDVLPICYPPFNSLIAHLAAKISALEREEQVSHDRKITQQLSNTRETLLHFVVESYQLGLGIVPYLLALIKPVVEARKDADP